MTRLPTVAYVSITLIVIAVLGSLTYLSAIGADPTEIRQVINTLANIAGLVLGGIGAVGGGIAARNAAQAVKQTDGSLDRRMRQIMSEQAGTDPGPDAQVSPRRYQMPDDGRQ